MAGDGQGVNVCQAAVGFKSLILSKQGILGVGSPGVKHQPLHFVVEV